MSRQDSYIINADINKMKIMKVIQDSVLQQHTFLFSMFPPNSLKSLYVFQD